MSIALGHDGTWIMEQQGDLLKKIWQATFWLWSTKVQKLYPLWLFGTYNIVLINNLKVLTCKIWLHTSNESNFVTVNLDVLAVIAMI